MKSTNAIVKRWTGIMVLVLLVSVVCVSARGDGIIPPMKPSKTLCTGYPTPPPTFTPTPTPPPTSTPVSEKIKTILCGDDAYVSAHSPETNFGSSQVLSMRRNEYYTYMRFNLTPMEPDARIIHSYLRLTPFELPPVSSTIKIYITANDWQEDSITYNNRPQAQGQVGSLYIWTTTNPIEIDLTDAIQEAYNQNLTQLCFVAEYESSYFDLNVESQETARPPLLKIFYNTSSLPSPTPTTEPTAGPGQLTTDIRLNHDQFNAGDEFILTAAYGNQQPYSLTASLWVVLVVGDAIWFWPEWDVIPSYQRATFIPGEEKILTPLQFTWPQVAGSATGLKFWSAILDEEHKDIAIDSVTFGWN